MMRYLAFVLCTITLSSCYKDEIDLESLNTNPFDKDYVGPSVFEIAGAYDQVLVINGVNVASHVIEIRVKEELFLSPASYSVKVLEQGATTSQFLNPDPPGSNIFKFVRAPEPGAYVCLELNLANNLNSSRTDVLCITL